MSFGVPPGAITPYQLVTSKPTMPSSSKVGTSGSCGTRRGVEIASARSFPLLMCSTTGGMVSKFMATTPASRSPIACPLPLYGMWTMSTPASCLNISPARCWVLPVPDEA